MDVIPADLLLHILVIHAPDPLFIPDQRTVNDVETVVFQCGGESHISGRVNQHIIPRAAENPKCADHAPQHAVLITDMLLLQTRYVVSVLLPPDDAPVILLPGNEVPEHGMGCPLCNRPLHRRNSGKIHVRHPHRNTVKFRIRLSRRNRPRHRQKIHRQCVLPSSVYYGCEIILHHHALLLCSGLRPCSVKIIMRGAGSVKPVIDTNLSEYYNTKHMDDIFLTKNHTHNSIFFLIAEHRISGVPDRPLRREAHRKE